jgi:hypothetical protein
MIERPELFEEKLLSDEEVRQRLLQDPEVRARAEELAKKVRSGATSSSIAGAELRDFLREHG